MPHNVLCRSLVGTEAPPCSSKACNKGMQDRLLASGIADRGEPLRWRGGKVPHDSCCVRSLERFRGSRLGRQLPHACWFCIPGQRFRKVSRPGLIVKSAKENAGKPRVAEYGRCGGRKDAAGIRGGRQRWAAAWGRPAGKVTGGCR